MVADLFLDCDSCNEQNFRLVSNMNADALSKSACAYVSACECALRMREFVSAHARACVIL